MPSLRTEVTEITTGLAMLGLGDLDWALAARPDELVGVDDAGWDRLVAAREAGSHDADFARAWDNGLAFLRSEGALRSRVPARIEWKGPDKLPLPSDVPADLRVDRVYLVSCKYLSKVLHNLAPAGLFDGGLSGPVSKAGDWFAAVAPHELQDFYGAARDELERSGLPGAADLAHLPDRVGDLARGGRELLKSALGRTLPSSVAESYAGLARVVAERSADRWSSSLGDRTEKERLLWRLLRVGGAPYFVLGASSATAPPMRLRIDTAWDWQQEFRLSAFEVWPEPAGQAVVRWQANVVERATGADRTVKGHVEVRWSHGRFSGNPEAKVYLDTPHAAVPGYHPLDVP
ncbi:hypothetical protein PO878_15025 [Iamia majanohamensis]|uniref:Uncharacterized protein n=1 Tax=Iamia majanohamensis TaxID=467976 RepID=A0AAF0BUW2_9ACTN|nr:hypothetical protein [Iamia majanohamensis]WCO65814.1 hypothetical protein PO878_15025 [Iamia majanohamensis]